MKDWMLKSIFFMSLGAMIVLVFWLTIEIHTMRKGINKITIEMEKALEELTNYNGE